MGIRSVFGKGHAQKDSEGIGAEDGVEELPSDRRHLLKILGATAPVRWEPVCSKRARPGPPRAARCWRA